MTKLGLNEGLPGLGTQSFLLCGPLPLPDQVRFLYDCIASRGFAAQYLLNFIFLLYCNSYVLLCDKLPPRHSCLKQSLFLMHLWFGELSCQLYTSLIMQLHSAGGSVGAARQLGLSHSGLSFKAFPVQQTQGRVPRFFKAQVLELVLCSFYPIILVKTSSNKLHIDLNHVSLFTAISLLPRTEPGTQNIS